MLNLLNHLIQYHTQQCSLDNRECKDAIMNCIFTLFENSKKIMHEEEWLSHIIDKQEVYCWSEKSIEKLQKIDKSTPVFLCTTLDPNLKLTMFNTQYHYHYKIYIKEGCYGINVNSFIGNSALHSDEQECLLKLKDIEKFEKIK